MEVIQVFMCLSSVHLYATAYDLCKLQYYFNCSCLAPSSKMKTHSTTSKHHFTHKVWNILYVLIICSCELQESLIEIMNSFTYSLKFVHSTSGCFSCLLAKHNEAPRPPSCVISADLSLVSDTLIRMWWNGNDPLCPA